MKGLEKLGKGKDTVSCYQFTFNTIQGLILDIKKQHSEFRRKVEENGLQDNDYLKTDAQDLVEWSLNV